jgi:glycosyltransferase involved in cell wall biosynthesis
VNSASISIVIPAFNEAAILADSLNNIRRAAVAFESAGFSWDLIVCDNNSSDQTADVARAAGARVVFEPINQIGRARNAGAAAATGEWLVFVDADSYPSHGLLADVADAIAGGRVMAGGSTVAMDLPGRFPRMVVSGWNATSRIMRWAAGSFIFCEASAFRSVGGFNLQLFAAEEIDLFRRLKRLARSRGKVIRILTRHPLHTSARKAHLYSPREFLSFQLKTLLTAGRTLRSADGATLWYDGRR